MTSYHHLYPFSPWGLHGGTLRLRTAVEASQLDGTAALSWWDEAQLAWRSDVPVGSIGSPDPESTAELPSSPFTRLKRSVFPFSLWETGRKRRAHVAHILDEHPESTLVLHTSPLAPLAAGLRQSGRRVVVDVHDAVFRGHLDDSRSTSGAMRAIRRTYSGTVRHREGHALMAADWLAVAGWDDMQLLARLGLARATWAPTGLEAQLSAIPESGQLCVGLLGNFYHGPTAQAASELIASPLGKDPAIQIILAGNGSDHYKKPARVISLGHVATIDEFYDRVHATVVPVTNGTGMKCKLAEAALAGKAVITTRLGAVGYPPELRDAFVVVDGAESLNRPAVTRAIEHLSPEAIRDRFEPVVGREAAARTYAGVLENTDPLGQRP
jgi:Glycosyl transferases group 1